MSDYKGVDISKSISNFNPLASLNDSIQRQNNVMAETMASVAKYNTKKDAALFETAEAAAEQVEYLKTISEQYKQIAVQNEIQANENKKIKGWTIAGVIIMGITLIAAIVVPIIIYFISRGGA